MTSPEPRAYAREYYSTISKITQRNRLLAALARQAEKEGGYRGQA